MKNQLKRLRQFPHYKAIFANGHTIRYAEDDLATNVPPEIYDIAINSKCFGACSYCYIEATHQGTNYERVVDKINSYFGAMALNERPFQVAIGGAGEPTLHPDFIDVLKTFRELQIAPNYTTNGMHVSDEIIQATSEYCTGVALTAHKHLSKHWHRALFGFAEVADKGHFTLNLHVVVNGDLADLTRWYDDYAHIVDHFVLLPMMAVGFAEDVQVQRDWDALWRFIDNREAGKFAYGAHAYEQLVADNRKAYLYPPHQYTRYIDFKGDGSLYTSSFDWKNPIKKGLWSLE